MGVRGCGSAGPFPYRNEGQLGVCCCPSPVASLMPSEFHVSAPAGFWTIRFGGDRSVFEHVSEHH